MNEQLRKLAEAPLATQGKAMKDAQQLDIPKRPKRERSRAPAAAPEGGLTKAQVKERQEKAHTAKQDALLHYYAGTDVPAERVARHIGFYRREEYKPEGWEEGDDMAVRHVPDIDRTAAALKWIREHG